MDIFTYRRMTPRARRGLHALLSAFGIAVVVTAFMVAVGDDDNSGTYAALRAQCAKTGGTWAEIEGISQCWR